MELREEPPRDDEPERLDVDDRPDVERPDERPDAERPDEERPDDERPDEERPDADRERFADFGDDSGSGTLAPFSRASDNPIAIACFRLVTRPPCPDFPLFSVPFLRRCIALSTDLEAASP